MQAIANMVGFLHRTYQIFGGFSVPAKVAKPIRFGILGAANVVAQSLITPAKQHPEVVVQGIASRDRKKGEAFASKHGIPQVFDNYQALLDDPNIDAVYIPLPNSMHYEWTLKALAKKKHVLLEKPSVSNAAEADRLFNSPLLQGTDAPVLLEASLFRFPPSWHLWESVIDQANISHVDAKMVIPKGVIPRENNIRWEYDLSGGTMMDVMYPLAWVRGTVGAEPLECVSCETEAFGKCDWRFDARWKFPDGVTAETHGNLQSRMMEAGFPRLEVTHKPVRVEDDTKLPEGQVKTRTRKATYVNPLATAVYHRIDIEDEFVIRKKGSSSTGKDDGPVVKTWKTKETKKAYTWDEAGLSHSGEAYYTPYRWQLGEFVDKIVGRPGTGKWNTFEDSIAQMRATDMAYEKSGLGLRPTSNYQPEAKV